MLLRRIALLAATAMMAGACSDEDPGTPRPDGSTPAAAASDGSAPTGDGGNAPTPGDAPGAEAGPVPLDAAPAATDAARDVAVTVSPDAAMVSADGPSVGMTVGAAGATLMLNEGKLFIPPGALDKEVAIVFRTVSTGFPALPGSRAALSSVVSLEPHGQAFAQPVRLTLYHFGGNATVALYVASPGGTFTQVTNATITLNTAEAPVTRTGYFVVAPVIVIDPSGDAGRPDAREAALPPDAPASDTMADAAPDLLPFEAPPPADVNVLDSPAAPDAGVDLAPDTAPDLAPDLPAGPQTVMVKVRGELQSFDPKIVVIRVGDTVTWTWEVGGIHSVVSGGGGGAGPSVCSSDGKFNSGVKAPGETFSFTFTAPGSYGYHCAAHCVQFEGGSVVVQ